MDDQCAVDFLRGPQSGVGALVDGDRSGGFARHLRDPGFARVERVADGSGEDLDGTAATGHRPLIGALCGEPGRPLDAQPADHP
ncbi:hypothetical protein AB0B25_07150 [Nocardia sp. NPDC049190]|uniref:hypothetical protein n=1 Tax=Nocardia sp. NPDC049190 TaxID=3155650 RepID=UPI0033D5AB20